MSEHRDPIGPVESRPAPPYSGRPATDEPPASPRARWWPIPLLLLLGVAAWTWIWFFTDLPRQERNLRTGMAAIATLAALLVWLLGFSRLSWKRRVTVLGLVLAAIGATAASLEIRGVTGDLIPVVRWRWSKPGAPSAPPSNGPVVASRDSAKPAPASIADYPQFLGPNRDATLSGPALERDWTDHPPVQVWRQPVGPAWSGFSVAGHRAVTQEQRGEDECVVCYDLLTGTVHWLHSDPAHYRTTIAGEGPRATPTISGDRVYTLGATGILNCLDLTTGRLIWTKNIIEDNGAQLNDWGMSGSPLVLEDKVIVSAGGKNNRSLVAYDRQTGAFVWGGGTDGAGYSSPFETTLAGVSQILIFNSGGVVAHDPETGTPLWKYRWRGGHPHVTSPLVIEGDRLLVSSGYGTGAELLEVKRSDEWSVRRLWKSLKLKSKFANLICHHGFIYGLDDGILVCLKAADGQLQWKEGRDGHGQLILHGGLLLLMAENGDLVLLDPNPEERRELARFTAFRSKTWNPPALAGEYLLVRNDLEAACYRLPLARP